METHQGSPPRTSLREPFAVHVRSQGMADFTHIKRDSLARTLRQNIQGEVRFDSTSRRLYSTDASIYQIEPLGVVIPRTTADLQAVVQVAAEAGVPFTARGGGTSLSGQAVGSGIII